jgi:hypothetical protein
MIKARGRPQHSVSAVYPHIECPVDVRSVRPVIRVHRAPGAILTAVPIAEPRSRPLNNDFCAGAIIADDMPHPDTPTGATPMNAARSNSVALPSGRGAAFLMLRGLG